MIPLLLLLLLLVLALLVLLLVLLDGVGAIVALPFTASPLLLLSLLLLSVLLLLIVSLPRPSPPFSVGLRVGIGTVALVVLVLLTAVSCKICWGCVTESNATRSKKRRSKKSIFPCH